jgi:hypothetical protein
MSRSLVDEQTTSSHATLFTIDPPFGLRKHASEGYVQCENKWDDKEWKLEEANIVLKEITQLANLNCTEDSFAVFTFCLPSCIGEWESAFKGHGATRTDVLYFAKDQCARSVSGGLMTEKIQPAVVAYFRKQGSVRDPLFFDITKDSFEDKTLMCAQLRVFPPPIKTSRVGRQEYDSWQKLGSEKLNPSQKSVELARWVVRHFSAPATTVVNLCEGSGTFSVAAAVEGRHSIGLDFEKVMVSLVVSCH